MGLSMASPSLGLADKLCRPAPTAAPLLHCRQAFSPPPAAGFEQVQRGRVSEEKGKGSKSAEVALGMASVGSERRMVTVLRHLYLKPDFFPQEALPE